MRTGTWRCAGLLILAATVARAAGGEDAQLARAAKSYCGRFEGPGAALEDARTLQAVLRAAKARDCRSFFRDSRGTLRDADLSGQDLVSLAPLSSLRLAGSLNLSRNRLADLQPLAALPGLRNFRFAGNPATDGTILQVRERLLSYFDLYESKSFEKFRDFYAPRVRRYITIQNPKIEEMIADAQRFYRDKEEIGYVIEPGSLEIRKQGEEFVSTFRLVLSWKETESVLPESLVSELAVEEPVPGFLIATQSEVVFDAGLKIVSYAEKKIFRDKFKVQEPAPAWLIGDASVSDFCRATRACETGEPLKLKPGTVVEDDARTLHDESVGNVGGTFSDYRRVRLKGFKLWVTEYVSEEWRPSFTALNCCNLQDGATPDEMADCRNPQTDRIEVGTEYWCSQGGSSETVHLRKDD